MDRHDGPAGTDTFGGALDAIVRLNPGITPSRVHMSFRYRDDAGTVHRPRTRRMSAIMKDARGDRGLCPDDGTPISHVRLRDESGHAMLAAKGIPFGMAMAIASNRLVPDAPRRLVASHIEWDADGYEDMRPALPDEILVPEGMTDPDEISDYISDVTGFCHCGFLVEEA